MFVYLLLRVCLSGSSNQRSGFRSLREPLSLLRVLKRAGKQSRRVAAVHSG